VKPILIKILILLIVLDIGLVVWRYSEKIRDLKVLGYFTQTPPTQIPSPTPTLTPTSFPTVMPTPTPTPTMKPTPTPTPTPTAVPQPDFSQEEIHGFIERFAAQYSVDPNVLRHIAACESGFNASAVNGPYVGLYQFGITSWRSNRTQMGEDADPNLRLNAEEAIQTAAFIVSKGMGNLWPNCFP
jgi:hypothetical protein